MSNLFRAPTTRSTRSSSSHPSASPLAGPSGAPDVAPSPTTSPPLRFRLPDISASAAASGEYLGGSFSSANVIHGVHVCSVVSIGEVCGGLIGSGAKFCLRSKAACGYATHEKKPFDSIAIGYYVKANENEAFTSPFIPADKVSQRVGQAFLEKSFQDSSDAVRYFDFVRESEESVVSTFEDLDDRKVELAKSLFAKTPAPKKRSEKVRSQYEELIANFNALALKSESLSEGEEGEEGFLKTEDEADFSPRSWTSQLTTYLQSMINNLSEDRATVDILGNKVSELFVQVGLKPTSSSIGDISLLDHSPSLWVAVSQLADEFSSLKNLMGRNKDDSDLVGREELAKFENNLDTDVHNLTSSITKGFAEVESALNEIKGYDLDPISDPYLNVALCSRGIQSLESSLNTLHSTVEQLSKRGERRSITIHIGKHSFNSMHEFGFWVDKHLPPSMPFGMFIDVFSYFQRIKSFRDLSKDDDAAEMEKRRKIKVTADEDITLNSFNHPLPRLFNGGSSPDTPQSDIWLPGISTPAKWENEDGTSGVKLTIEENEEQVNSRIASLIDKRLSTSLEARALATQCLTFTSKFVTQLIRFISDTHRKLTRAGYDSKRSWQLVSKVVHRLFATDCHFHRGLVNEIKDAEDRKLLTTCVLWATFCTHEVMKEYSRHGIENHPSVASEYVRFLVANAGHAKLEAVDSKVSKLTETVKSLEARLKAAEKAATTASNRADEAVKEAKAAAKKK